MSSAGGFPRVVSKMPHQISPPLEGTEATLAVRTADSVALPSHEEVSSLLTKVFTAETSQGALDAAYSLTHLLIKSTGFRGLHSYGILAEIKKAAADKKSGAKRESAMILLGAVLERFPPAEPLSEVVFLLQEPGCVTWALDALADKGAVVRESAEYALDALYKNIRPESKVVGLLPVLSQYLGKRSGKWQGTVGAYGYIEKMANDAKIGMGAKEEERLKDVLRESMGRKLASLIPVVEAGMHDLKSEVGHVYQLE